MPGKHGPPEKPLVAKYSAKRSKPNPKPVKRLVSQNPKPTSRPTAHQADNSDTMTTTTGETEVIYAQSSNPSRVSLNSLSVPLTSNDPGSESRSPPLGSSVQQLTLVNAGVATMATSIEGNPIWMSPTGQTFKRVADDIYFLDESIPKWVKLVPEQGTPDQSQRSPEQPVTQNQEPQPGTSHQPSAQPTPAHPGNSWTNLEVRDVHEIMSRRVGASPLASHRQEMVWDTCTQLNEIQTLMSRCQTNLSGLQTEPQPQPCQPGTSEEQQLPVIPEGSPIGIKLTHHSLYKHVLIPAREKAAKGLFLDYKTLLIDPLLPLRNQKLTLVRDPDSGNVEWVEKSVAKEITSFDQWLKAHMVYAAMYVEANPQCTSEIIKYESLIHNASLRFDWDAILLYDFHFRQGMAEDPLKSWGESDVELYTKVFMDWGLPKRTPWGTSIKKSSQPCHGFNQGNCKYKKCKFAHKCSKCQNFGHPVTQCRSQDRSSCQIGDQHPQPTQPPCNHQQ